MGRFRWTLLLLLLCKDEIAHGAQWRLTPSLTLRETYSDNINLRSDGDGAWVTEFDPGISASGEGARLRFQLNYRLQNILSTQSGRGFDQAHQLQANSTAELIQDAVFLDARASAGQTLVNPQGRQFADNLSNTGNRGNFYTFGLSPYWRPHLGGYAEGEVRLQYNYTTASGQQISASQTHTESASFRSGHRFTTLTWQFSLQNNKSLRTSGQNVQFRNAHGEIRYRWTRTLSTFVQGGFQDNNFRATTNTNQNGLFYTAGVAWVPSRLLRLEGGLGRNSFATVTIEPSRRTTLQGTFRHNNVGTNTGNVFQALIRHRTRRTVWQGRYSETTTTTQTVLTQQQIFAVTDPFGNPVIDPVTSQPAVVAIDLPRFVDEVFVSKRGDLSFTGRTAKNTFTFRVYNEKRIFQESRDESKILGVSGSWTWRLGGRTNSTVQASWQKSDFGGIRQGDAGQRGGGRTGVFWTASLRLTRRLTQDLNAYVEYRHQEQSSDEASGQNQSPGLDYQENRVVAAITMRF